MSEPLRNIEALGPGDRIQNAVWNIELGVHGNLAEHANSEVITLDYVDEAGTWKYDFSRTPQAIGDDVSYLPTLTITRGDDKWEYCWLGNDDVVCYPPELGATSEPERHSPSRAQEMATALEWLQRIVDQYPTACTIDGRPLRTPPEELSGVGTTENVSSVALPASRTEISRTAEASVAAARLALTAAGVPEVEVDVPERTPVERVWELVGEIEILAHGPSGEHSYDEILAHQYVDHKGDVHSRFVYLLPFGSDDEDVLLWPALNRQDGDREEGYHLSSDTEVWHWPSHNLDSAVQDPNAISRFIQELEIFIDLAKHYPQYLRVLPGELPETD